MTNKFEVGKSLKWVGTEIVVRTCLFTKSIFESMRMENEWSLRFWNLKNKFFPPSMVGGKGLGKSDLF